MRIATHLAFVPSFEEILAEFVEESEEVFGALSDIVSRGRLQADYLEPEALEALSRYDLVVYLISRTPGRPVRTWVYPTPMGLRMFSTLEREAEREEERQRKLAGMRNRRRK